MNATDDIAHQWPHASGYLDTASYGLPPAEAILEVQAALRDWQQGSVRWETWMPSVDRARQSLARLLHVDARSIATGATVSELVGLLASAVPDDSRILTAGEDFTSLVFPWAAHHDRGVITTAAPLERLAESIDSKTTVVAVSAVQSGSGAIADLEEILAAAEHHDARTVLDVTQALGWMPCDASRFDAVVGAGYKWLLCPRGVAFMYLRMDRWPNLKPLHAGWAAGPDQFDTYYGLPLRLADTARQLDTSPAWFSWVGAAPALERLEEIGIEWIHAHNVALADRLRVKLGFDAASSAIVSLPGSLEEGAGGLRASVRAGRIRVAFHLYNTDDDIDRFVESYSCA